MNTSPESTLSARNQHYVNHVDHSLAFCFIAVTVGCDTVTSLSFKSTLLLLANYRNQAYWCCALPSCLLLTWTANLWGRSNETVLLSNGLLMQEDNSLSHLWLCLYSYTRSLMCMVLWTWVLSRPCWVGRCATLLSHIVFLLPQTARSTGMTHLFKWKEFQKQREACFFLPVDSCDFF